MPTQAPEEEWTLEVRQVVIITASHDENFVRCAKMVTEELERNKQNAKTQ